MHVGMPLYALSARTA